MTFWDFLKWIFEHGFWYWVGLFLLFGLVMRTILVIVYNVCQVWALKVATRKAADEQIERLAM